jgi:hypothetical protein
MSNTPRLKWPYPAQNEDPFFDSFKAMVEAQDSSAYASREDRQNMLAKGGLFSWNATTGVLSWDAVLELVCPSTGYRIDLSAGSVTMLDGQSFYINLIRGLNSNSAISTASVATVVPNTDEAFAIGFRRGTEVYFRTGQIIRDGETRSIFCISPGLTGSVMISPVWAAGRESHNSDTPLVVGAFAFDPTDYIVTGGTTVFGFRGVAANGADALTNHVQLYNRTNDYSIAVLDFTSMSLAKDEEVLVVGTGAGKLNPEECIYEVRAYLGAAPGGPLETIMLYSAELRVVSTLG